MDYKKVPGVSQDLVEALDKLYPNTLPQDRNITIEEIRYRQGQRQVVDFLRGVLEKQQKNALENS